MKTSFLYLIFIGLLVSSCGNNAKETEGSDIPKKDSVVVKPKTVIMDGPYVEKYPDGQVRIEGVIKNGERNGQWTAYYPDGTKQSEDFFEDGKKNGKTATFYKNGKVRYIGYFKWDKPDGDWAFYDTLGNVATKKEYK
jgi:antitoxin component YwqK of YwqJK toxin-antitoxin module